MAFKHALVVDDSKSARIALKKLLEKHQLIVDFAESGEAALEFLSSQRVDVIFMDHTMPGMDGLEAVSAIKGDPRTAMIPVMMYTAKEGEVYVGQARALGAIGVLPKQVHPAELFDVLLKLGLVEERRARPRPIADTPLEARADSAPEKTETAESTPAQDLPKRDEPTPQEPVRGIALEGLVTRILQDQHVRLRADIRHSHEEFARQVAHEIFDKQRREQWLQDYERAPARSFGGGAMTALAVALLLPALVLAVLFWQTRSERDAALAENARLADAAQLEINDAAQQQSALLADIDDERRLAAGQYFGFVRTLEWSINADNGADYSSQAFDDRQMERLQELLVRLQDFGYTGAVLLESHLGEFCLADDGAGGFQLAAPDLPVGECSRFGHPLDASVSVGDRQSLSFANFLSSSPLVNDGPVRVDVVAHGRDDSLRRHPYPASLATAGEWNAIARRNNRVQYTLLPDEPGPLATVRPR